MSLYSLALSGLNTAQTGLETTSHNIDNSATTGYSRQVVIQQTAGARATGDGYIGMGVQVTTIQRQYDSFLSTQLRNSSSLASQYNTQYTQLSQIDSLLATSTGTSATLSSGIQPALTSFFSSLNAAASDPSNSADRQDMVGQTSSLVSQINLIYQQMQNQRQGINTQLGTMVTQINSDLDTINQLNQQVAMAYGQSGGQPPNDLLDERDEAISDLSQLIGIQTYTQSNTNTISISLAGGQPLLSGTTEYKLSAATSSSDPTATALYYSIPGPNGSQTQVELQDSQVTGGSVGGLLAFRQQLNSIQNQLGQFSIGLAMTMNNQQEQGLDQNGNPGTDMFSLGSSSIVAGANSGSATVSMTAQSGQYTISYDGSAYTVKDPSGNAVAVTTTTNSSGNTVLNFNGFSVTVSGGNDPRATAANPDTWTMQPFGMTTPTITASSTNGQQNVSYNITYTGSAWQVTDSSGNPVTATTTANGDGTTTLSFNGFNVSVAAGTVTSGDSWTLQSSGTGSSITAASTNASTDPALTASSTTSSAATLTANAVSSGDYKITYNGTNYTVTDPSGNAVTNASGGTTFTPDANGDITFHGMVINVSGNAASGDSWQIDPDGMSQVAAISNTHNTSTAALSASYVNANQLQASDYSIVYTGGTSYQVTRQSDGTVMNLSPDSQGNLDFDGLSVSISGVPAAGDKWELQPTRYAAGLLTSTLTDPSKLALSDASGGTSNGNNGLAMAKLQTADVLGNGTLSLNGMYAQLVDNVGVQTQQLDSSLTAQNALVTQQTSAVSSVSGVNLNEEYVNLTQYQQQYQASAKILDVASTIFDAILGVSNS